MSTQVVGNISHWNRSSPIPTDPCYNPKPVSRPPSASHLPLKGPISSDPGMDTDRSTRSVSSAKPRVKPEALSIARNHQGKELAYLFNPAMKVIPIGVKAVKQTQKDHGKENFRKIKEIQRANRDRQVETSRQTPMKAVYKPDKFEHVQSKVAQRIKTPQAPRPATADGTPSQRNIQRSLSTSDLSVQGQSVTKTQQNIKRVTMQENKKTYTRPQSAREERQKKTRVVGDEKNTPKRPQSAITSSSVKKQERPKSHIKLNKQAVRTSNLKRSPSLSALDDLKKKKEKDIEDHRRGSIPKYLRDRQARWKREEDERIANIPDPTIPAGHVQMDNRERKATLDKLKKSHVELLGELKSMPLSRDTLRIKARKDELEKKLRETDSAIKIFSRERVFIKIDD
eukprot:TCONS_00030126-protein